MTQKTNRKHGKTNDVAREVWDKIMKAKDGEIFVFCRNEITIQFTAKILKDK